MEPVVLSIKPSLEHLVEDNSSSTKHLMTAITRTFQESSECPADDLCFLDLASIDHHIL